jgi:CHASE2 domain-containing sensor protein
MPSLSCNLQEFTMRRFADFDFPASPQTKAIPGEASKTLAGVLLSAVMASLLVVADQVIENWADGHLLLGWVALWSLVFAGLAFCARPLRRASTAVALALETRLKAAAQARNEARMWELARMDPRVMDELRAAAKRG